MAARTTQTLTLMVDNEFGVLTRITALVRREGWNIKSLAVAETLNPAVSRLTLCVECLDNSLPNVLQRLGRLNCVRDITVFTTQTHLGRELVLVRVSCSSDALTEIVARYGAKLKETEGSTLLEAVDSPEAIDRLLGELKQYGALDAARSGMVTLEKSGGQEQ
jgi:acetolactate synthase I/III small subunit